MSPTVAICLIGLGIICAIAAYGIHGLKSVLPPRPEQERAEDFNLAGTSMKFRRLP